MEVEFRNVTVTIGGVTSPKQAYDLLCEMLAAEHILGVTEFQTDTFVTRADDGTGESEERPTSELFPNTGGAES